MLKAVTIMTERYGKILKRGAQDRTKLLFRSLAVFDRRVSAGNSTEKEKPTMAQLVADQKPVDMVEEESALENARTRIVGFAIDEPAHDDEEEEEDDDELALAALDSLDAIEVFSLNPKMDRKIHHAQIPVENFKKLLMLLLVLAPLGPQEDLAQYSQVLTEEHLEALRGQVDKIVAAFEPGSVSGGGIRYSLFIRAIASALPHLFDPLNPLFEHFLFSKKIDLSKHRDAVASAYRTVAPKPSPIISYTSNSHAFVLTPAVLSHLSTFLPVAPSGSPPPPNLYHANARFHHVYSTATHGTSMSSFSRHVSSWGSSTLLLVTGTPKGIASAFSSSSNTITLGAYLTKPWSEAASSEFDSSAQKAMMFQLSPRHAVFPANPFNRTTPISNFSSKTGIALGCIVPPSSRTSTSPQVPILGPVSLRIDSDISIGIFQHDQDEGTGAFLPDLCLEHAQRRLESRRAPDVPKKVEFEIDRLEVWGVVIPGEGEEDEAIKQKKRLAWEEAEAARRRAVNLGGDKDGARALLEMAGLVGDQRGDSGGSI